MFLFVFCYKSCDFSWNQTKKDFTVLANRHRGREDTSCTLSCTFHWQNGLPAFHHSHSALWNFFPNILMYRQTTMQARPWDSIPWEPESKSIFPTANTNYDNFSSNQRKISHCPKYLYWVIPECEKKNTDTQCNSLNWICMIYKALLTSEGLILSRLSSTSLISTEETWKKL